MNIYLKRFLHRGVIFAGLGPIILGIIYAILDSTIRDFSLSGKEILIAICSVYLIAFVQAGASVFNQIESWPLMKSLACHFASIYAVYLMSYLVNTWIPFDPTFILVFTLVFIAVYFTIYLIVVMIIKSVEKKLNSKIEK